MYRGWPSRPQPASGLASPAAKKALPQPRAPLSVCLGTKRLGTKKLGTTMLAAITVGAIEMSGRPRRAPPRSLLDLCRMRKLTIATAESCTGGLVAGALTDIPGSSDVIDRGFVTYSNDAKRAMLGVRATTLATFGAVSKETATAMAVGALEKAGVDLAVSITGIAGPGGATPGKPVGLVHLAVAARDGRILHRECRFGAIGRSAVRQRSVVEALRMLTELARGPQAATKPRREAASRIHPRVARSPRRGAAKRRRPPRT